MLAGTEPALRAPAKTHDVWLLSICQALFFMANTIAITTIPLVGLQYAPSPAFATIPLGLQFAGTMAATYPASLIMGAIGRRSGLMIGALFAILSGAVSWHAVMIGQFWLFCVGTTLYGVFAAFASYYRFAAADSADAAHAGSNDEEQVKAARARAIAWVLAGGVVAAVIGPELAKLSRDWFAPIIFAGCYVVIAILGVLTCITLAGLKLRAPTKGAKRDDGRPLAEIFAKPDTIAAVTGTITAYVTMNLLMTATPIAMMACGLSFSDTAFVIQGHVLGMFLPSFFTGKLIARYGTTKISLIGAGLLLLSAAINLTGIKLANFFAGLVLLGLGWNFLFIASTTLLTTVHRPEEKAKVQGMNDLLLFSCVVVSASGSGFLHDWLGWQVMNVAALIFVAGFVVFYVMRRRAVPAPA